MENLHIYNQSRVVPPEAIKPIEAGRLKGMSDINPMWRIKKLTELFGPVGLGWYYKITNKETLEGSEGQIIAVVDIQLFVKYDNEWSMPIEGTGGASFVAKEKNGPYTNDECFKMALTDAISVACKSLGIGADVYFSKDNTKYSNNSTQSPQTAQPKAQPSGSDKPATEKQLKLLYTLVSKKNYQDGVKQYIKNVYNKDSSKDLTSHEASELIEMINGMVE